METNGYDNLTEVKNLSPMLEEFIQALHNEIEKNGQSSILIYSGKKLVSHGDAFWYQFSVEYAHSLPPDTPCSLHIGGDKFDVTVVSFEENTIVISSKNPLPDTIQKARLDNGAKELMEKLIS